MLKLYKRQGLAIFSLFLCLFLLLFSIENFAQGFQSVTNLNSLTVSAITGEKPQSKVWTYAGKWWMVMPNSTGTHLWRLDGTAWTSVLDIDASTATYADCKAVGSVTHILLYKGTSSSLVSVEYVPASTTYQLWTTRTATVSITLDGGVETATIDIDGNGRMWLASPGTTSIYVRWSDSPYSSWSSPITITTGVNDDDICAVTAFDGKIGVLWSNQNTQRFGFKYHVDGADPSIWSADEVPASQSALNIGLGMADDHLNIKAAADGTIYAAVKTSYDTPGYPKIALLVRRPAGTWDNLYGISESGTRGIILLNEAAGKVKVIYSSAEGNNPTVYNESLISAISFGSQATLISSSNNDVTSTKQNYTSEVVIIASNGSSLAGVLATDETPNLVAHWKMDETSGTTLVDASTFNNNATTVGSPTFVPGVLGNALTLNGTTQYATAPNSSSLNISGAGTSSAITLAAWIKPTNTTATTQNIIKKANTSTISDGYELSLGSAGSTWPQKVFFRINQLTSLDVYRVNSTTVYPLNGTAWMHIAATFDGTTMKLYVNGIQEGGDVTGPAGGIVSNTLAVGIGAQPNAASFFTGLLDDARIYNRALTLSEIQALATAPPTPPSAPTLLSPADLATGIAISPTLSWNASSSATSYQVQVSTVVNFATTVFDQSGIATTSVSPALSSSTLYYWRVNATNANGTSAWSSTWSFTTIGLTPPIEDNGAGYALDFDGLNGSTTTDYVNCGNGSSLNITTSSLTIEAWIKPTVRKTHSIVKKFLTGGTVGYELFLEGPSPYRVSVRLNNSATYRVNSTTPYPIDGTWMHVAGVFDYTSNTVKLFVNGIQEGGNITGPGSIGTTPNPLTIGSELSDFSKAFQGMIDEVRVWNVAKSDVDIRANMTKKLVGNETGLVGYWRFDETTGILINDVTSNNNDGTMTNMDAATDHVWSGAALGDASANQYVLSGNATATLNHTNGDGLTATTTSGTIKGIQVYRADDNAIRTGSTGLAGYSLDPLRFWGVRAIGTATPTYTLVYNYTGNPAVISETGLKLVKRADISVAAWTDALATLEQGANTLTVLGQTGTEYALAIPTATTYQLTVTSTAGGTITAPASSPATVNSGAATTITAVTTAGYTFTGWTVVSGSGVTIATPSALSTTATLTSGDAAVRANFTLNTYQLTVTSTTGGTITAPASSPVTVNHGAATTITAVTTAGYTFTGWTVVTGSAAIANPSALSTTATLTSGDAAVRANFVLTLPYGLQFDGTNDYVTFGAATSTLGAQTFTLECWFNWTGGGVTTSTGTGGLTTVIPLLTKGRGEFDGDNRDMNYFLGIQGGKLAADFEDIDSLAIDGDAAGQNQPIFGTIAVTTNDWHHAAAIFDGTTWRLYLDGVLDNTTDITNPGYAPPRPQFNSIQHAALGTAMTSTGAAGGYFAGVIDEARIWNTARTQLEIQTTINSEVTSGTGLLGRWGLNDGTGISAINSIAGSPIGTLTNGPVWVTPGAPFNISFNPPPNAPTNLVVTPISSSVLQLGWTDNSSDETNFEIERSTTGSGGTYSLLATVSAGIITYSDATVSPESEYCYRVRATNGAVASGYAGPSCATTPATGGNITLTFQDGLNSYTGTRDTYIWETDPSIARGSEATFIQDKNVGDERRSLLRFDLSSIPAGATIQSATLQFYVDTEGQGFNMYRMLVPWDEATVTYASLGNRHFAADGNDAETSINANWPGVDTYVGFITVTVPASTIQGWIDGNLTNNGWLMIATHADDGQQLDSRENGTQVNNPKLTVVYVPNSQPNTPTVNVPLNGATGVATSPTLDVTVSDPDADNMTVSFYGRPKQIIGADFTIVALPDAQNYTAGLNGGTLAMFTSQTTWCVNQKTAMNIVYVAMEGDITNDNNATQWDNAVSVMSILESPAPGIPYGISIGNHDGAPGATTLYNEATHFGIARFDGRSYYGGHYGTDNDNNYALFSASGMDFIVINLGSGSSAPTADVLLWANTLMQNNITKRAIVVSHHLLSGTNWDGPGLAIYNALKGNPNLFMMLCGHLNTESMRTDTYNGNTIYTVLTDYQGVTNGGNGWLRNFTFSPANNTITLSSYSPHLSQSNYSAPTVLPYNMSATSNFALIGTDTDVASGSNANITWPALSNNTEYEWYVTVSDGIATTTSSTWSFTTEETPATPSAPSNLVVTPISSSVLQLGWTDNSSDETNFEIERSTTGIGGTYSLLATVGADIISYSDATVSPASEYCYRVRAMNGSGASGYAGPSCATTPATAYDVYLSSSTSASAGFIYPNDDWSTTGYESNDWDLTAPVPLYIVPEVGSVFGASDITIQWDNTMYSYAGVENSGIYAGANFQLVHSTNGNTDQVIINSASTDNTNFTISDGQCIAKLNLNLLKSGFGQINLTALNFRRFNGLGGQVVVPVTGHNAQVKSYLGDVASSTSTATGDGLVEYNDLSPWSGSYWSGVGTTGMANYKVKYDVGPTNTSTVYGIPIPDSKIQFEDLIIFSMSYGLSASHVYPKLNAEPTAPVELQLGDPIIAGNQTRVPLFVSGGVQNVRAMNLTFAGTFGKLVGVEKGALLNELVNPVMVMSNVEGNQVFVDLAVFGADEFGISKEGEVVTLIFEGNTDININTADIRNILNGTMAVNISGSVETVPTEFALMQNYPNPFNPSTMISYSLPTQSMVEISVFNALGEKVATLVNELKEAGRYSVELNAGGFSSGIYFYQITANDFVSVKKMILMK